METKHVSQFYPCSKVTLGSELFYLCELGKYLKQSGYTLSLDGVILDNILKKSRFWDYLRVAVKNEWVVDVGLDKFEMEISVQHPISLSRVRNVLVTTDDVPFDGKDCARRREDSYYDWMTPKKVQISYISQTDECWYWGAKGSGSDGFGINLNSVNHAYSSQVLVSILASVAVHRLLTGVPKRCLMKFDHSLLSNKQLPIADVHLLCFETDAMNGWFDFDTDGGDDIENQCGFEAWWYKGFEMGYLRREYSGSEKRQYLADLGIKIGDVVLLYERNACQSSNYIKNISSMKFAIVRGVAKDGITLEYIVNKRTRYGYDVWFESLPEPVQKMYGVGDSYKDFRSTTKKYSWLDIGVNYMMRSELFFITPLQLSDAIALDVTNGIDYECIWLPEEDAIYWLLKDYGVDFNEEHYLSLYFPNRKPAYTRYIEGDSLPDYERKVQNEQKETED